jgi:hypothetical protein
MDMKRILQAMDGVATKPVQGADSMAKFLRVVTETEINPQPAVNVPPVPQLPAQDGDQGNGEMVKTNQDGTRSYSGAFGTFIYDAQGKAIKYTTPNFNGYGQTIDLTNNQTTQNYNQGPLNVSKTTDAKGKQVGSNSEYTLGNVVASQQKDANGQTTNTLAPVQEGINKFLSIVRKNDVSILNEGSNPHKVALPVQMTMQHYQKDTVVKNENSLLKKYFHEVETEITEQKTAKRQLVNQYASVIAERILKKGSRKKILNEGSLEVLRPGDSSARDDYDKVQFRIDGETIERGTPEFDYYYKEVFKKDPPNKFVDTLKGMMSKDHGSMDADPYKDSENDVQNGDVIIPSHEKGHWVRVRDIVEAPIEMDPSEPNNPMIHSHEKANPMHLKDRIAQARAQLKELAQLSESNELIVWEKITRLSKGGMFMGLEQNLEQIRHGINELVQARRTGKQVSPKARGGIDKRIG